MRRQVGVTLALLLMVGTLAGCSASTSSSAAGTGAVGSPGTGRGVGPDQAKHVLRGKELAASRDHFHQLGLFYNQYVTEFGKPPARPDDLLEYFKRDHGALYQAFKEGRYVLNLKSTMTPTTVLAYEKNPDINNQHLVVFAGGNVELMPAAQLQAQLMGK